MQMKFQEFPYSRPNIEELKMSVNNLLEAFNLAGNVEEQNKIILEVNRLRGEFESMSQIVSIRQTVDTTNVFYEQEQEFFDVNTPIYQGLVTDFYRELLNSKYRGELEKKWGLQLFRIAQLTLKTFSPEIIEDLQLENKLSTDYTKLIASAKIPFEGQELNLSGLGPYLQSTDRELRKKASEAKYSFFIENEEKLDEIYDNLVKVRTGIAHKLGYANYIELGYDRMLRSDYTPNMVVGFRKQVEEYLVPVASKLRERQRQRLKLDELRYYDEKLNFLTGNAVPQGDSEWILQNGRRLYQELSPETDNFFTFMIENELMDLVTKKGKAGGGYCTYISKYQAPFIFSNFNGTAGDIDVLTHEAGHAFQVYTSRDHILPEYQWPTYESCEIHSMSMEFFAWPWMELFFKEAADKYRFTHLSEALLFIPYGVTVDEFQHFVYEHPEATPEERKNAWRLIEKTYLPHRNYEENEYLERGSYWHQQNHIFGAPFYYIDYTLAQICAFQFWKKSRADKELTWQDYLRLCRAGGSMSFLELVNLAGLISPFENNCLESVIGVIDEWLEQIEDQNL
jgi:M3 family oligoendopeptidase